MTCEACDVANQPPITRVYPIRLGNDQIGYGTIEITGCTEHVSLAMNYIRQGTERQS